MIRKFDCRSVVEYKTISYLGIFRDCFRRRHFDFGPNGAALLLCSFHTHTPVTTTAPYWLATLITAAVGVTLVGECQK